MGLRIDTFREQTEFPERTRRRKAEEREKKGYNSYTTLTQLLYRSYLDHFWAEPIVLMFNGYSLTSAFPVPLLGRALFWSYVRYYNKVRM